jgi:tripartite-type tricarboxylate transporter receptor subunit TctC
MSDKLKYISLSEVVKKAIEETNKTFVNFWDVPTLEEYGVIITEDIDFEIIEPKQLPQSTTQIQKP